MNLSDLAFSRMMMMMMMMMSGTGLKETTTAPASIVEVAIMVSFQIVLRPL